MRFRTGLLIMVLLALAGCGVASDPIAQDLREYRDAIAPLGVVEADIIAKQESVVGKNYKDDETTFEVYSKDVVPAYAGFVTDLEDVRPATPEVRELHEVYIKAANLQQAGFARTLSALEKGDSALVADANREIAEGRSLLREWQSKLESLQEEHPTN